MDNQYTPSQDDIAAAYAMIDIHSSDLDDIAEIAAVQIADSLFNNESRIKKIKDSLRMEIKDSSAKINRRTNRVSDSLSTKAVSTLSEIAVANNALAQIAGAKLPQDQSDSQGNYYGLGESVIDQTLNRRIGRKLGDIHGLAIDGIPDSVRIQELAEQSERDKRKVSILTEKSQAKAKALLAKSKPALPPSSVGDAISTSQTAAGETSEMSTGTIWCQKTTDLHGQPWPTLPIMEHNNCVLWFLGPGPKEWIASAIVQACEECPFEIPVDEIPTGESEEDSHVGECPVGDNPSLPAIQYWCKNPPSNSDALAFCIVAKNIGTPDNPCWHWGIWNEEAWFANPDNALKCTASTCNIPIDDDKEIDKFPCNKDVKKVGTVTIFQCDKPIPLELQGKFGLCKVTALPTGGYEVECDGLGDLTIQELWSISQCGPFRQCKVDKFPEDKKDDKCCPQVTCPNPVVNVNVEPKIDLTVEPIIEIENKVEPQKVEITNIVNVPPCPDGKDDKEDDDKEEKPAQEKPCLSEADYDRPAAFLFQECYKDIRKKWGQYLGTPAIVEGENPPPLDTVVGYNLSQSVPPPPIDYMQYLFNGNR